MDRKPGRWLALCAAALPALLPLWLILKFGVDMPHWDQWDASFAGLYLKAADGTLSLWDFTVQFNEHRVTISRVLEFALGLLTGWNTVAEMLLEWLVVLLTSLCLLYLTRQTVGGGTIDGAVVLLWFLSNLMLFSVMQYENWLWGIGLMNAMPTLFIVGAMAVLYAPWRQSMRVGVSIVLCACGMFSCGQGIVAFPLVGVLVAWSNSWQELKAKRGVLIAWSAAFLVCILMYAWGYTMLPPLPGPEKVVTLWDRLVFLLTFLGNQFVHAQSVRWQTLGLIGGAIVAALFLGALVWFCFLWLRRRDEGQVYRMLPWVLIGFFVLFNACLAAIFRPNVGLSNAIASRYTTTTLYLYIALIHLIPMICQDLEARYPVLRLGGMGLPLARVWARAPAILGTALVVCWLYALAPAWQAAELICFGRLQAKAALLLINVVPENPKVARNVYPKLAHLRHYANRLDHLGYLRPRLLTTADINAIRDPRYPGDGDGKLGVFEGMTETAPNTMTATGWATKPDAVQPVDAIILTMLNEKQQEVIFACSDGVNRRLDLVISSGDERYELTGWQINYPTSLLPRQLDSIVISAWALDSNTGKVRLLRGRPVLTRVPQGRATG